MDYEKEIEQIKKRLARWENTTLILSIAVLVQAILPLLDKLLK